MSVEIILMYLAVGLVAGLIAGLLGVGGGLVIVPILVYCFPLQGIQPDQVMHLALGTSMASIVFTSISSMMAHHRRGGVDWSIFWRIVPGIIVGTFCGALVASKLPTNFLKGFFAVFIYFAATNMLLGKKPKGSRDLPGTVGMFGSGGVIGVISSWVGIGGGSLSVPFFIWCNVDAHRAIGTSAAVGLPLAIAGASGYILKNLHVTGLPAYSVGYVYLPALVGIVCVSVLTAPLGARLAHALPVGKLKKIFAIFLYLVATKMAWSLIG